MAVMTTDERTSALKAHLSDFMQQNEGALMRDHLYRDMASASQTPLVRSSSSGNSSSSGWLSGGP
jgi:hypothetical protein